MNHPGLRPIATGCVLALLMAGCAGTSGADDSREAEVRSLPLPGSHQLVDIRPFEAFAGDGTPLRGHVYLPDNPSPLATVLELSPYWNTNQFYGTSEGQAIDVEGRRTMNPWMLRQFLEAGFAVALVNPRGSGESEGCFEYGSSVDWADASVIIEALAGQPWSNGRVGMTGLSYAGWTQYWAAASAPPALRAIIPVSAIQDPWSLWSRNGAAFLAAPLYYKLFIGGIALGGLGISPTMLPDTHPSHAACPQYPGTLVSNDKLVWSGDRDAYWDSVDLRPFIDNSTVPMFVVNGMTEQEGHVLQFEGIWDRMPPQRRLLVGQWGHGNPMPIRNDFPAMAVAWMDEYLRDAPKVLADGIVEWQDDSQGWHNSTTWPPESTMEELVLSGETMILDTASAEAGIQQMLPGPWEDPSLESCGPQRAVYVSPPLRQDVTIGGNFVLNVRLTSSLNDGNLAATLFQTSGDGACPDPNGVEVRRVLTDLRHYKSERGDEFPVGTPTDAKFKSYPVASVLKAGNRLVLVVTGESGDLVPDPRKPTLTITTGPGVPSSLSLPVVEGTLAFSP